MAQFHPIAKRPYTSPSAALDWTNLRDVLAYLIAGYFRVSPRNHLQIGPPTIHYSGARCETLWVKHLDHIGIELSSQFNRM